MIEEDRPVPVEATSEVARYGESLLYDFSKFMTTLSLIALGGVLTLTQASGDGELKPFNLGLVIGAIAGGGVFALSTANALVDARAAGRTPSPRLHYQIKVSMALIAIGVGAFLNLWWDTLR